MRRGGELISVNTHMRAHTHNMQDAKLSAMFNARLHWPYTLCLLVAPAQSTRW